MAQKTGWLYWFEEKIFSFIGDIKWSGIKRPFWFTINATGYQLKGEHYRVVKELIQPGDILIRRFEGYIDKWFIPGYWNHAGIYIGDDGDKPEQVVHAISEGVVQEDFLNFIRTDHMLILRAPGGKRARNKAIKLAKSVVGSPYDFGFDFKDTNRFSCTELVSFCYPGIVEGKKRFGKTVIVADDFHDCEKLEKIWDSRFSDIKTMGVVESFFAKKCPIKNLKEKNEPK